MKEKTFGELKIGDKIYTFNINKRDNRIIEEGKIKSIDDVFYIIDFSINFNKNLCDITLCPMDKIIEKNGILYATSKLLIFEWIKSRCDFVKCNLKYYQKKIKSLEEEISKCEENIEYYRKEKGKLLSFIGRLKDRYYL